MRSWRWRWEDEIMEGKVGMKTLDRDNCKVSGWAENMHTY